MPDELGMSLMLYVLSDAIPLHPISVFAYAAKHDYPDLMSEAAPLLLDHSLTEIVSRIPVEFILPWVSKSS